jgi:hypothetical protein
MRAKGAGGWHEAGVAALIAAIALVAPDPGFAQATSASPGHPVQLSVGGLVFGETSFDSIDAEYITNTGGRLTIFRTENALRPGFGLELHLGVGLTRALEVEATGSWARADLRSRIVDDVEGVGPTVIKERVNRFGIEGAALWVFSRRGKAAWFARGSAGWVRELTGNDSLVEDGVAGSVGGGMKYLWNQAADGGFRIAGFRVEGRVLAHKGGVAIGPDRVRWTPAAAGSLIMGF